ncbi:MULTISPECIES: LPS export ABC transporter permease LptF [Mesorhizobium]|uniref:LPS export ABC transporter permease LptF n=1 Tax=Mesorhizobium denitrificans TaxID=2294114 RepID=A0A371XIQ2_9HYPH|nr:MULTISPECIES: LPS export ABC transporter permease LptF [Mesorhizobium]RFC69091.1 LPS export ABC transporter permease LptF [Mesorhizobium denitrificans]
MKVLERYILRRVLAVFAAALGWTLAIVWTTQVLARIDLVTDSGQTALTFFQIATLVMPTVIPLVLPFALIIGITQTLATMNADSELAVISASGASRMIIIKPIMLIAIAASVLSFAVDNYVEPPARQKNRELIADSRGDLLSLVLQEGAFRRIEDGLYVQIGERLPDGKLGQIFVADSREPNIDFIYYAKTGTVLRTEDKSALLMFDGVVQRKTLTGGVSVIRFASYSFDLGTFTSEVNEVTLQPKDQSLAFLVNPDSSDKNYQRKPQAYRAELHRRLTEWLYPAVFALIAIAVAGDARSHREARVHPMITSIVIALLWWWVGYFVSDQAETEPAFVFAMYAVPILASGVAIAFIAMNRALELPMGVIDWIGSIFRALWRAILPGRRATAGSL